ncbi:hypothetical protein [Bradyrhizobium sp. ARR65]|uniref:hypothetical protein n=1 Tax=Bradyrhizobium sp. ARR65 TaxID=1040989 RepID=UPI000464151D|nr:hypothetical protein [Bradyrhizobium sp. ARR65]
MPAFSFEKISPPVRRNPITQADAGEKRPRGLIVQLLDRLSEARVRRSLRKQSFDTRQPKSPD